MKKKLLGGLSALALTAVFAVTGATPAEATTRYPVCNSGASNNVIYLKNLGNGWTRYLYPGDCVTADNDDYDGNGGGDLRINPDPELYGWPDTNRYQIGEIDQGYRSWVDFDPDGDWINPPDAWYYNGVRVHTD